jgi:hypothetical protein
MRAAGRIAPAGRIVCELAEHPGAEDRTERGHAVVDRSVRLVLTILVDAFRRERARNQTLVVRFRRSLTSRYTSFT